MRALRRLLTPQTRFRFWTLDVVAFVIATHAGVAAASFTAAWAAATTACAIGMALLILTTPVDAIRLPAGRSVRLLAGLTVLLYTHAGMSLGWRGAEWAWAAVAVVASVVFAARAGRARLTPWWVAPLWWNPLMVGPYAARPAVVAGAAAVFVVFVWSRNTAND